VSRVYLILLKDLRAAKACTTLSLGCPKTNPLDISDNAGPPGIPDPYSYTVLWYFSREQAAALR
jgi:hypothetical protein